MKILIFLLLTHLSFADTQKPDPSFKPEVPKAMFAAKHPVILFDLGHKNLAAEDGRYSPVIHLLESDGFQVKTTKEQFTAHALKDINVLYISAAQSAPEKVSPQTKIQSAFSKNEMDAIQAWVKNGGSLLLMADHPPIGEASHDLAARFGIKIANGETNDKQNFYDGFGDTSHLVFTRDNHLILDHQISKGLNKVIAFSGESLTGPKEAKIILAMSGTAENRYFDTVMPVPAHSAEALAMDYGKGRIVAFGDGTVFTSKIRFPKNLKEGINADGIDNVKLATNVFRWLVRAQ